MSCSDLERLCKIRSEVYLAKFPSRRSKRNLSRNVYRVFNDLDLAQFFSVIKQSEVKFGLAYFLQLTAGFRIGEVAQIRASQVDFERGVISLMTEKANVSSDQPVPAIALEVLQEWIQTNGEQIAEHNDFVFFSGNPLFERDVVSVDVFRNYFGRLRRKAGLIATYAERNDKLNPHYSKDCALFKLTTHSLRRTYLTRLYQECRKKELVAVLARHKKKDATDCYIFFDHSEQLELVNKVFNREPFKQIAGELIEKIRL